MNKNTTHRKRGFTLIELIISMGILAMLLLVLTDLFLAITNLRVESEATSSVEQDGRYILSKLIYDINNASAITTPGSLGTQTSTLVLTLNGVTNTYALSSGNLVLTNTNGSNNLNSLYTTISNFTVLRLGNTNGKHALKINYTATTTKSRNNYNESKSYQTTVSLR